MSYPRKKSILSLSLLLLLTLGATAHAGTASTAGADGTQVGYEYRDNMLRLNMSGDPSSYMVMRDGHIYIVNDNNGQPMVIDANAAWSMASGMIDTSSYDMMAQEVVSLKATGKKETHAGITGEVYNLHLKDKKGKEQQLEIVLADDARALAFRDAMQGFAETAAKAMGKDLQTDALDMEATLSKMNKGVLRVGNDMKLVAISDKTVDPTRFELPAKPMQLPSFGSFRMPQGSDTADKEGTGSQPSMKDIGKAIGNIFGN